jgi:hypothetical protein
MLLKALLGISAVAGLAITAQDRSAKACETQALSKTRSKPETQGPPRNAKLRDIPNNTWVRICDFKHDVGPMEVRWSYYPDRKWFVRVGGCTNSYSNEIWSVDVGAEAWTCNLPYTKESGNKERPGHGCNRGICYDPFRKCIWTFGGASSYHPPGNTLGLWKGTGNLGKGDWKFIENGPRNGEQAAITLDPDTKKLVLVRHVMGTGHTVVFDPETGKEEKGPASPHDQGPDGRSCHMDYYPYFQYIPELKGCLFINGATRKVLEQNPKSGLVTWLFDPKALTWKDLGPKEPVPANRKHAGESYDPKRGVVLFFGGRGWEGEKTIKFADTWVYELKENRWVELKPKSSPPPGYGMLLAYDPEHDVHVLGDRHSGVWVFRYKKE